MNGQSNYIHSSSLKELISYIDWEIVKERYESSHKTKQKFYNEDFKSILSEMAASDNFTVPSYKVMSSRIQKIQLQALLQGTPKAEEASSTSLKVKVLELPAKAFKSPAYKKQSTDKAVSQKEQTQFTFKVRQDTTITINISGGKSISFNTSTPEESVAKLLRSLEQH